MALKLFCMFVLCPIEKGTLNLPNTVIVALADVTLPS